MLSLREEEFKEKKRREREREILTYSDEIAEENGGSWELERENGNE